MRGAVRCFRLPAMPSPSAGVSGHRSVLIDLSPMRRSPAFARLFLGDLISGIGTQMTIVAVSLEIYARTASTLLVGAISAVALVPAIVFGLYGGALADAFDRRKVSVITAVITWSSTALIAAHSWFDWDALWLLYVLTAVNASGFSVIKAAKSAIIPRLLPPELIPAASALTGVQNGLMITVGPALAGTLVATVGYGVTYAIDVALFSALFLGLFTLPSIPPLGQAVRPGFTAVLDGLRYLRQVPQVSAGFVLDLAAMTFGSPRVLMPAVGALVLGGGAGTSGALLAAPAIGTMLCGLFSGRLGRVRRQGAGLAVAVWAYGASILGFGLTLLVASGAAIFSPASVAEGQSDQPLRLGLTIVAFVFLALSGAADNVSMVFRQTMLQTSVPDHVRGRMQGIFIVVVTGGPRIGDMYAGALAAVCALWVPSAIGGLAIIAAVCAVLALFRGLWRYDSTQALRSR